MNHIYRSIWSDALNTWIAVAEHTKTKGKRSTTRNALLATGLLCCTPVSWALPTGEQLVAGQAIVNTPATNQMQIQQTSQQAIINWQGFSIQQNEAVNIQQPNANAALLNRVVGQDASQIQGQLNANGQVYLVNPNGVVFGKTAQVDVGGLIATTHNISDTDFLNGKNHFTQNGATGSVDNQGNINTPDGGVVALISERVSNSGAINTPKGTTALAAGKTVDLDFQGNGLVEVKVPEAALNAQINNQGAIQADGGRVVLTAKAAGQLIDTVINQQGIIRAQSMVERNGEIILDGGDNGIVQVSGTLDAASSNQSLNSNTTGGTIKVTGQQIAIQNSAIVTASGNTGGGTINVLADMNNGTVNVAGKLDASAPNNGNGGFIETSAAHVKIADSAKVTTKANNGTSGNWLIDPVDFTIAAVGGDMTGAAVSAALLGGNFIIQSTTGAGGVNGDVNVNDVVTWAANTLTLNAQNNININANMNASGLARLDLLYGQGAIAAGNTSYIITKAGASVNLPAGTTNFTTKQGSDGVVQNYTVITSLGAQGSISTTDLQGMNGNLGLNYVLGADINAAATSGWNTGEGFMPVGNATTNFLGIFEGLGHAITGLTINRPTTDNVGLFGYSANSISNVGLIGGSIIGQSTVGGLAGLGANINNAYATGSVTGISYVGGVVGDLYGNINNAYSTANVTGNVEVGGLVGQAWLGSAGVTMGSISNSYATGTVIGNGEVGGLVGANVNNTVTNVYATGDVNGNFYLGGLIGFNETFAVLSNAYATGNVTATAAYAGGLVGYNTGGNISNVHATGSVNGNTAIGGLVGINADAGSISNTYATGIVNGVDDVGGLVGINNLASSISNSHATGSVTGTGSYTGGLVGSNDTGIINNSYATGSVTNTGLTSAGGLVGINNSTITNAYATGNVAGVANVGGLVGANAGAISNSFATGNVSGTDSAIGGLVGYGGGSINNSFATGTVTGADYLGGLVGQNDGNISSSYATGNVLNVTGWGNYIGGLVGRNYLGSINNAYATGNVTGTGAVGGLVGENDNIISNAYATGNVSGVYGVGGLAGYNWSDGVSFFGNISNAYATGLVKVINNPAKLVAGVVTTPGGLVSLNSGVINNSFWDTQTTGLSNAVGSGNTSGVTGKTTAEMKQLTTFSSAGWNISDVGGSSAIWRIYEGNTRPLLRSFLIPLTITTTGSNISYSIAGANTSGHLFTAGSVFYSDQQGYDISQVIVIPTPLPPPPPPPVITPPEIQDEIPHEIPPVFDLNFWLSQISQLELSTTFLNWYIPELQTIKFDRELIGDSAPDSDLSVNDNNDNFSGSSSNPLTQFISNLVDGNFSGNNNVMTRFITELAEEKKPILPVLQVKNSAGQVKRLRMSKDRQFLSLLLEDGSVRIWDFQSGMQRQIDPQSSGQVLTDLTAVDDKGQALSIASKENFGLYDVTSLTTNEQEANPEADIQHFTRTDDGRLLLLNMGNDGLKLWDNKRNQALWQTQNQRGTVNNLAVSHDKHHGAILSTQPGVYEVTTVGAKNAKPLTDALDIIELSTGKVIKSLPNLGEQVIHLHFKDDDTLQIGLASGKLLDWSLSTGKKTTVANFPESVIALDNDKDTYAYVSKNGGVRVGDGQEHIHLSIENKSNPFKYVQLIDEGKKLLTVLASGDLSLWDVESGQKMLRLFSSKRGWTVMDALGRFDGSEDAMENFSWLAKDEDIPLDKFSESYYEPGLLNNVIQNQDYLNHEPDSVAEGISLPPKIDVQLAEQQDKGDKVALQMDVYNRGGGIDKVHVYHNGKIITDPQIADENTEQPDSDQHIASRFNITPTDGKNTLKVVASNDMGIENSSQELNFDGKSKAYTSSVRLLTIGINQYSDARLNLNYSVADANAIEQALKNQSSITSSKRLTDEKATKPQILAELRKLSQGAQQDSLIIYFAGHGIAVDKEWYFLPYETKLQPTPEKIAASGITATELGDIFKDSKIQHIMLVVDSCYSGAGVDAFKFKKLENNQRYFARKMSRTMGITVIAATTKDQEASELESLGHGLFTYALTQELQKKDKDAPLTAHNIADSITKTLPAFSKKMLGFTQDPVVFTKGSDFTLGDTGNNKKAGDK